MIKTSSFGDKITLDAMAVKDRLMRGLITYDEAINHQAIKKFEDRFNTQGKIIAKNYGRKFYPINIKKFLR